MVLGLAEVLRAKKLRQTNDLPPLLSGFAHPAKCFVEVSSGVQAAPHLNECDSGSAFCSGGLRPPIGLSCFGHSYERGLYGGHRPAGPAPSHFTESAGTIFTLSRVTRVDG